MELRTSHSRWILILQMHVASVKPGGVVVEFANCHSELRELPEIGASTAMKRIAQEAARELQTFRIDSVTDAGPHMPFDRHLRVSEDFPRHVKRLDWDEIVLLAVDQLDGRTCENVVRKVLGTRNQPGKANNRGRRG